MVQSAQIYVTYEDYLEAERVSPTKNEWLDGVVYAPRGIRRVAACAYCRSGGGTGRASSS